jgi:hypothetical protein
VKIGYKNTATNICPWRQQQILAEERAVLRGTESAASQNR